MKQQPSGIRVGQMRVPIGVFGMIFESRPNVTIEAASLSIKSGNACILRGGSEAIDSNKALARLVQQALAEAGLPADAVQLVQTTDREAVGQLIAMPQYVDVIIPRGGKGLIERISREAKVPVIKHLDGNCHVYVDDPCDIAMAVTVADNAKTQKYSPCNASEGLLVARGVAARIPAEDRRDLRGQGRGDALRREAQALLAACPGREPQGRHRAGLVRGIPRAHHQHQGGGRPRRGHRAHQPLLQPPHRRHHHARPRACPALPARGGFGQRDGQRQHRASPTASSTAWAPKSASAPTSSMPAGRSASKASPRSSGWCWATAKSAPEGRDARPGARRWNLFVSHCYSGWLGGPNCAMRVRLPAQIMNPERNRHVHCKQRL